jgi:hypothetical protein
MITIRVLDPKFAIITNVNILDFNVPVEVLKDVVVDGRTLVEILAEVAVESIPLTADGLAHVTVEWREVFAELLRVVAITLLHALTSRKISVIIPSARIESLRMAPAMVMRPRHAAGLLTKLLVKICSHRFSGWKLSSYLC